MWQSKAARPFRSLAPFFAPTGSSPCFRHGPAKGQPEEKRRHHPHRNAQRLSDAQPVRENRVRIAEDFGDVAEDSIKRAENRREQPGAVMQVKPPQSDLHDREEDESFHAGLVELTWMARHLIRAREHHRPRDVRNLAPQLTVDEIRDTSKK